MVPPEYEDAQAIFNNRESYILTCGFKKCNINVKCPQANHEWRALEWPLDVLVHSQTHTSNFLSPLKSVQLSVVRYKKSDPLVPLIHYAEGKPLLREIILQILQIHNKAFKHTHA